MEKLISIIVPIYKVEQYLSRCVDSLLNQDYCQIEIILVDDGSPDGCGNICEGYARRDSRIRVIHQPNLGLSAARNSGIEIANGDYLMFVDSDDFVENMFCSYAISKAIEFDSDIVVFGYNDVFFDRIERRSVVENEKKLSREEALSELCGGKILSFAWNKLYKASLFEGVRYPKGRLYEDIGTTYLLFDKANAVYLANGITYNYRKRNDSILGKEMTAKDSIDWFDMAKQRCIFIENNYPRLKKICLNDFLAVTTMCLTVLNKFSGFKNKKIEMENLILSHKNQVQSSCLTIRLLLINREIYHFVMYLKRVIWKIH